MAPMLISVTITSEHPLAGQYLSRILRLGLPEDFSEPGQPEDNGQNIIRVSVFESVHLSWLVEQVRVYNRTMIGDRYLGVGPVVPIDAVRTLLRSGFHGYITHGELEQRFATAVQVLAQGHLWASAEVLNTVANGTNPGIRKPPDHAVLTAREEIICDLLQERMSNKQIASELGISERTVKFHVANIFCKLGVRDRYLVYETRPHVGVPPPEPTRILLRSFDRLLDRPLPPSSFRTLTG